MATAEELRRKMAKKKQELESSHQSAIENKDKKQFSRGSVIIKEKLPEGVGIWNPKPDDHLIDVLAWFATKDYPSDSIKEDDPVPFLDLWVYKGVGSNADDFVSPSLTYKKKDPIAEFLRTNRDKATWKSNSAKRRLFYLVWVHDTAEEEAKGVQVWEVANWFFGAKIEELAKKPRGGGAVLYSDYSKELGKSVFFRIKKSGSFQNEDGKAQDSLEYTGHQFVDRDADIPDRILEQIFPLESVITLHPSYEEIYEAFYGEPYVEGAPSTKHSQENDDPSQEKERDSNIDNRLQRLKKQMDADVEYQGERDIDTPPVKEEEPKEEPKEEEVKPVVKTGLRRVIKRRE